MELFLQSAALVMVAVILSLMLGTQMKAAANLVTLAACCLILGGVVRYLEPVLEFAQRLKEVAGITDSMLAVLLKVTGVGLIAEVAVLVCTDTGNGALGKAVQILSNGAILWASLPLFEQLLELLEEVLAWG